MDNPILPVWTLLFYDGTKRTVNYDPATRIAPPGLYAYVKGSGSTMFHTPDGWETTEQSRDPE